MEKIMINGWYQLSEFPSIPYTPSNFWNTMCMIDGVILIEGEKPELKKGHDSIGEFYVDEPYGYHAVFYFKNYDIKVFYRFGSGGFQEAFVTLDGEDKQKINKVEEIIRGEHRKLDEKLRKSKIFNQYTLLDFVHV